MNIKDQQIWFLTMVEYYCKEYDMTYEQIIELLSEVARLYKNGYNVKL